MRAGLLRHTVTLQSKSVARDSYGGEVITWVDEATPYANCEPLNVREYIAARQGQVDLTLAVSLRYRKDVRPEWRLVWEGSSYDIVDIIDVGGRHKELKLLCRGTAPAT